MPRAEAGWTREGRDTHYNNSTHEYTLPSILSLHDTLLNTLPPSATTHLCPLYTTFHSTGVSTVTVTIKAFVHVRTVCVHIFCMYVSPHWFDDPFVQLSSCLPLPLEQVQIRGQHKRLRDKVKLLTSKERRKTGAVAVIAHK